MIVLKIRTADREKDLSFEKDVITLGRKSANDVRVDDKKASRHHAKLECGQEGCFYRDLESRNGSKVNGRAVERQLLYEGDEIQIGDVTITIVSLGEYARQRPPGPPSAILPDEPAAEEESPAEPEEKEEIVEKPPVPTEAKMEVRRKIDERVRTIDEIRARATVSTKMKILRKLAGVAAALILVIAVAVVVVSLANRPVEDGPVVDKNGSGGTQEPVDDPSAEAEQALKEFRAEAEAAVTVTDKLLDRAKDFCYKFAREYQSSEIAVNPFETIFNELSIRREQAISGILDELNRTVRIDLEAGRFGEAMAKVKRARQEHKELGNDHLRELMERINSEAQVELESILAFGERLESLKRYDEAAEYYRKNAEKFANTQYHARIFDKPETMADLAVAEKARIERARTEMAKRWETPANAAGGTETEPGKEPAKPVLSPLTAKALEAIQGGNLASVKVLDGVIAGADELGLEVRKGAEREKVAWNKVPAKDLFAIYSALRLRGDDLLAVCEFGYVRQLTEDADKLLRTYVGTDKNEKKQKADELLARVRGEPVPDGGYTWNARLKPPTFESPAQITNRVAMEKIDRLADRLAKANTASAMDSSFSEILTFYEDPGLTPENRDKIKEKALTALKVNKKNKLEGLTAKAKGSSFGNLRTAKLELNKRREEALKVIYDTSIYLPENHPDWPKGDKINGQAEVDRLVDRVREIWNHPISATMPKSLKEDVKQIKAINDKYLEKLGEAPGEDDLKDFQEVVNNLNVKAALTLKTFSLNGKESSIYSWNRRVEKYNASLQSSDVSKTDKEHCKIVNDYREMMGRKRCFIDARLCRATKGHSKACDAAGRIWHVGSDGSPGSRAKEQGFNAGVGENVAIGYSNPRGTWWDGWYRASDHHRNGLSDAWNCMGYGFVGRVGTQNFANIGAPKGM